MSRLPIPGSDSGNWGDILNDFLSQAHNSDGTVKPGAITKATVGLGDVDNTNDAAKPISTATQTALDAKAFAARTINGQPLTADVTLGKADVGLGSVDNTADIDKPVSTAQAAADARTALGSLMDPVLPRTATAEVCTQTWAASTGYSGEKSIAYNNALSLGLIDHGCAMFNGVNASVDTAGNYNSFFIEFWCVGTDVAVQFRPSSGTTADYKVWVDGHDVSGWQQRTYPTQPETYLRLNWSTSAVRKIRVAYGPSIIHIGIAMPSTGYVYADPRKRFSVAIIGDSHIRGGLAGATGEVVGASNIAQTIASLTGWDVYSCGIGSTGYAHGTMPYGHATRMTRLATLPPLDAVIVWGGFNDMFNAVGTGTMATAATALYTALATARPNTPIIVSGVQSLSAYHASGSTYNDALKAAALAHPAVRGYIDWFPTDWLIGTGNAVTPNGTGNNDLFLAADNLHPTRAGAYYIAKRLVAELARIKI